VCRLDRAVNGQQQLAAHAVDRRFNRARYDAEAIVTAFHPPAP
jgi:hypothetical protein